MLNLPHAPATLRNREPIFTVLQDLLQTKQSLLEIASGTGEHAAWMGAKSPHIQWQPSDLREEMLPVIDRYNQPNTNVLPAILIDVEKEWAVQQYDVICCINMIHIAPWRCGQALLKNARRHLNSNGYLYLYGPYKKQGQHTAISNAQFDRNLRLQNPNWGVRDMDDVISEAESHGLSFQQSISMPANNFSLIFTC